MARETIQGRQETPRQAIRLSCELWLRKEWLREMWLGKVWFREDFDARDLKKCHGIQRVRVNGLSHSGIVCRSQFGGARRRRHLQAECGGSVLLIGSRVQIRPMEL